jgi:hypothetical protein
MIAVSAIPISTTAITTANTNQRSGFRWFGGAATPEGAAGASACAIVPTSALVPMWLLMSTPFAVIFGDG